MTLLTVNPTVQEGMGNVKMLHRELEFVAWGVSEWA